MLQKHYKLIVAIILAIVFTVSLVVSKQESTTMDEKAHIPSAYTYVKYGDMRLNPEHPPLLKDLAGIPLLFLDVKFPTNDVDWTTKVTGLEQWSLGDKFLHSNDADKITFWARFPILLIAILLGIFIFRWTKELVGTVGALFALILYAADPNILGHNHYVTTDLGIAAMILISFYYFIKFLKNPDWKNTALAGIFLGIVQLTKFSAVLLFPYYVLIILVYSLAKGHPDYTQISAFKFRLHTLWDYTKKFILILVICFVLIWILYAFNTANMPGEKLVAVAKYVFGDEGSGKIAKSIVIGLSSIPLLKSIDEFLLGIFMVFVRVSGGNTFYYFGEVYKNAVPSYFPAVFLLKETIPFLFLILFSSIFTLYQMLKNIAIQEGNLLARSWKVFVRYLQTGVTQYTMFGFILLYSFLSITGNLNIGFRHLFPIMALLYILVAKKVFDFLKIIPPNNRRIFNLIFGAITIWVIAIPIYSFPSYLSYFNEAAGGPKNGYKYVTDSNLDWGQDLKRLSEWVDDYNKTIGVGGDMCKIKEYNITHACGIPIDKIRVDYFGGSNPAYHLGDKFISWTGTNAPEPGWYAISALFLQESIYKKKPAGQQDYSWTKNYTPIRIGDSIFVYYVPAK